MYVCHHAGEEAAAAFLDVKGAAEHLKVVPLDTGDSNSIKQLTQLVETQYNQQIDLLVSCSWLCV